MRIAVVSPHLPTPALPMRGKSHDEQLRQLAAAGHEVLAVVPLPWSHRRRLAGGGVPDEEWDGSVVVMHPRYARVPRVLGSLGRAAERALFGRVAASVLSRGRGAPDVVLAQSATLPGGMLGRLGNAVFVVALHDHELYEWAPRSPVARRALVQTLRLAHCAVYVSEALRHQGNDLAGPHRSAVIPIGIETFEGLAAEPPAPFTICTVARLIARKRVDRLIRVFARLRRELPDARLVIVGDGPERLALVRLARSLGVQGQVQFTGALDARAARVRMSRATVMALPSVLESLGAVYLEAMSLGVPPLGTRGEGIEEYIEHGRTGLLVPPGDDEALFRELRSLAGDRTRAAAIGAAARRRFFAWDLSWRGNAEAYLALFAELAKGRATQTT